MAKLMKMLQPLQSEYVDRRFDGTKEEYFSQLEMSSTLYIGNLSFYTNEDQIYALFSKVGPVHRVVMGLDRNTKRPCGFCFVAYHRRGDAVAAVKHLNGTKLDNRQLRVDIDYGFEEGRQYGRGRSGGQVRDEFRTDYDADRGGYGRVVAQQLAAAQLAMWNEVQAGAGMGAQALLAPGAAVFFGQEQRAARGGQQQEQQQQQQQEDEQQQQQQEDEGAEQRRVGGEAADGDGDGGAGPGNPRLNGRGGEQWEGEEADGDDAQQQQQGRRKRQRLDDTVLQGGGQEEAQQQEEQQEEERYDQQQAGDGDGDAME